MSHGKHAAPRHAHSGRAHSHRARLPVRAILVALVAVLGSTTGLLVAGAGSGDAAPDRPAHWRITFTPPGAEIARLVHVRTPPKAPRPATARVATFNLLGCDYTSNNGHPGSQPSTATWPSCQERFAGAWGYVEAHDFSIVGFQEVLGAQQGMLRDRVRNSGGRWASYPDGGGEPWVAVAWRADRWKLLKAYTIHTPKYSRGGGFGDVTDPVVLLQSRTGVKLWVIVAHNIPLFDPKYGEGQARDLAIESGEAKALHADGTPVIFLGDTNDPSSRTACAFHAALGEIHSVWGQPDCRNPGGSGINIDKIIGSSRTSMSGGGVDWSTQGRRITDHGVVSVDMTITNAAAKPKAPAK